MAEPKFNYSHTVKKRDRVVRPKHKNNVEYTVAFEKPVWKRDRYSGKVYHYPTVL